MWGLVNISHAHIICIARLLECFLLFVFSQQTYFALGSGHIKLKTSLLNSGDDAFLPRLTLRFPDNVQYINVLQNVSWCCALMTVITVNNGIFTVRWCTVSSRTSWCSSYERTKHRKINVGLFLQDNAVSCDVTQDVNSTMVEVDCSVTSLLLPARSQVSVSWWSWMLYIPKVKDVGIFKIPS